MKKITYTIVCTAMMVLLSCNDSNKRPRPNNSGVNPADPMGTPAAQDRQNTDEDTLSEKRGEFRLQDFPKLYNTLELTGEQKEKLDDVQKKYKDRMKNTGEDNDKKTKITRQEMEWEIHAILTHDQYRKFQEMKKDGNVH